MAIDRAGEDELQRLDPVAAAVEAGLYYVMDGEPGLTRKARGKKFMYLDERGKPVTDARALERIHALVIPPAWTDVWICVRPNGHIQATGRDSKGRKQYRYHAEWNRARGETKFSRMIAFGEALPAIRARVAEDMRRPGLSHARVTALVIRLLEHTLIRVGNREYALKNRSYGLTTLLDDHIAVSGSKVTLAFNGKRGKPFEVDLRSRRLARLVKRCQDLPGQQLFQYVDENGQCCQAVTSGDVNRYLREVTGQDFTAKNFRTWGGTVLAAIELYALGPARAVVSGEAASLSSSSSSSSSPAAPADDGALDKARERRIVEVVKTVAAALGNTPTVCRRYYIHPAVLDSFRDESLFAVLSRAFAESAEGSVERRPDAGPPETGLAVEEAAVLRLIREHPLEPEQRQPRGKGSLRGKSNVRAGASVRAGSNGRGG